MKEKPMAKNKKRAPVVSLTIFFLVLLSSGLSGYYVWQGFLRGFDKYLPILCSTLLLDGLGVFALVFKVSFETRRRAMVPFLCSLLLLVVCAIHLAALANARIGAISQDESDARTKALDDDRHARNVADANALVAANCAQCSPERKRRMYQSEMSRLEKSGLSENGGLAESAQTAERSWGRRYVEDYATAVQLIFGLLAGLAMLINNFVRLYADEPEPRDEFLSELDVRERAASKESRFQTSKSDSERQSLILSQKPGRVSLPDAARKDALKRLREHLKAVAFYHPNKWFKADLVRGGVTIRLFERQHGHEICISQTTQSDKLLAAVERPDFRNRLVDELIYQGFPLVPAKE